MTNEKLNTASILMALGTYSYGLNSEPTYNNGKLTACFTFKAYGNGSSTDDYYTPEDIKPLMKQSRHTRTTSANIAVILHNLLSKKGIDYKEINVFINFD